ncbi:MAG: hypothetical protein OEY86_00575 [Nitrospira sp.]|nr:hypothetical protein [Nitrospira sp.]
MTYLRKCSGLVLGLLWLLMADLATAGEDAPSTYKILMSKQDQLCQIVLDELNERSTVLEPDYAGPLNYDAHPGMASIRWRPMKELESPLKENEGASEQFHRTTLDFNHDGKEDIVVQHTWNVFGYPDLQSNAFYFFDVSYRGLRQTHTRQEFFRSRAQKGFGGGLELQEYWFPEWYPVTHINLAPLLYLFVFHGDSYLHIVPGRGGGSMSLPSTRGRRFRRHPTIAVNGGSNLPRAIQLGWRNCATWDGTCLDHRWRPLHRMEPTLGHDESVVACVVGVHYQRRQRGLPPFPAPGGCPVLLGMYVSYW